MVFVVVLLQWKEVKPEELMDSKLRCVFEFPDDKKTQSDGKLVLRAVDQFLDDNTMWRHVFFQSVGLFMIESNKIKPRLRSASPIEK